MPTTARPCAPLLRGVAAGHRAGSVALQSVRALDRRGRVSMPPSTDVLPPVPACPPAARTALQLRVTTRLTSTSGAPSTAQTQLWALARCVACLRCSRCCLLGRPGLQLGLAASPRGCSSSPAPTHSQLCALTTCLPESSDVSLSCPADGRGGRQQQRGGQPAARARRGGPAGCRRLRAAQNHW